MCCVLIEIISVKKSYYKLARLYHPDRVSSNEKDIAKEKFNIIHTAYAILSDATKKKMYDEGSQVMFTKATMAAQWENYLTPISANDIDSAKSKYHGSSMEKRDIIREFVAGNGSMTHMLNHIPFMRIEDENRIIEIVKELMDNGQLSKMSIKKIKK